MPYVDSNSSVYTSPVRYKTVVVAVILYLVWMCWLSIEYHTISCALTWFRKEMQKWDCVCESANECVWVCTDIRTHREDETRRAHKRGIRFIIYLLIHAHTITHPKCSTVWMPTLRTDLSCNQCVGPLNFCALSIRQPPLQITQNEIQKNHDRLLNVWKTFLFHFNYFFFFPWLQ